MVISVELGSYVQQVTAAFQLATQSGGTAMVAEAESGFGQNYNDPDVPPVQLNAGLMGERPDDTDTPPGAYLDIIA